MVEGSRTTSPGAVPSVDPRSGDGTGRRSIGGSLRGLEPFLESPTRIARGGTSVVYRARHRRLDQWVAVKVLDERHVANARVRRRFEREGLVLASLRNDSVVRVLDRASTADGRPALILEWLDGPDIERRLRSHGPFTEREATPIVRQVVQALAAIHRAGVVHRDVKPSNVVLVPHGDSFRAVLLDFGVVGDEDDDTTSGTTLGTPAFMAPEQARDASAVSPSADVYAVGALYYTMVVGEPPHGRGDAWSQLHRMAEGYRASLVDAAPFVPRAIAEVFDRCLSHDPALRPRDGAELLEALDAALARPEVVLRERTHPMRALAVAALATLGAGAFGARLVPDEHSSASELVLGIFVFLAIAAIAGLALRERSRFTDAGYLGRLDRLFYEAAPSGAIGTSVALVATAWADARGWTELDPTRASLAIGLAVFVLSVIERARPTLGQLGRISVVPTSRSSASSLPDRSSGGSSTSSSPRERGTIGSSSPS